MTTLAARIAERHNRGVMLKTRAWDNFYVSHNGHDYRVTLSRSGHPLGCFVKYGCPVQNLKRGERALDLDGRTARVVVALAQAEKARGQ